MPYNGIRIKQHRGDDEMEKHILSMPDEAGKGLTDWYSTCSCGARFHDFYGRKGFERRRVDSSFERCAYDAPAPDDDPRTQDD
jgi:hypothetical protein